MLHQLCWRRNKTYYIFVYISWAIKCTVHHPQTQMSVFEWRCCSYLWKNCTSYFGYPWTCTKLVLRHKQYKRVLGQIEISSNFVVPVTHYDMYKFLPATILEPVLLSLNVFKQNSPLEDISVIRESCSVAHVGAKFHCAVVIALYTISYHSIYLPTCLTVFDILV